MNKKLKKILKHLFIGGTVIYSMLSGLNLVLGYFRGENIEDITWGYLGMALILLSIAMFILAYDLYGREK